VVETLDGTFRTVQPRRTEPMRVADFRNAATCRPVRGSNPAARAAERAAPVAAYRSHNAFQA
jgi:hypothetical protein